MYAIVKNTQGLFSQATRIASTGNLVTDNERPSDSWLIARKGANWPILYDTRAQADEVIARQQTACEHDYEILSHEESKCRACGLICFTPDFE